MKTAAIYARVSSAKQKEENTIASQTAALIAFAAEQGCAVPAEWTFEDEGYSGASLIRPGLERVRDLAAEGELDAVLVYAPDRLSRRYAYQIHPADRGVGSCRCRDSVYPLATGDNSRGSTVAAVPGHDRGIRAGADPRTFASRQATSRPTRAGQRAQRRALRLSLCSQERAVGGVLRDQRGGGAGRSMGV